MVGDADAYVDDEDADASYHVVGDGDKGAALTLNSLVAFMPVLETIVPTMAAQAKAPTICTISMAVAVAVASVNMFLGVGALAYYCKIVLCNHVLLVISWRRLRLRRRCCWRWLRRA